MLILRQNRKSLILGPIILLSGALTTWACNIPVFRFALERWRPDVGEILVFTGSSLTQSQSLLVQQLKEECGREGVNLQLRRVDIDAEQSEEYRFAWQSLERECNAKAPYVLVRCRHPKAEGNGFVNAWHGSLEAASKASIGDSPARKELARRLLAGHAVVWLVIPGEDEKATQDCISKLQTRCKQLESYVELPDGIGLPGSELYSEVPLLVQFSVLQLDDEAHEELFFKNWLRGFYGVEKSEHEPLVVPVFGRGRALEVIPASSVNDALIEDLTLFLCGACSCQVKDMNPGFDLLLDAQWETDLFGEDGLVPSPEPPKMQQSPVLLQIPPGRRKQ